MVISHASDKRSKRINHVQTRERGDSFPKWMRVAIQAISLIMTGYARRYTNFGVRTGYQEMSREVKYRGTSPLVCSVISSRAYIEREREIETKIRGLKSSPRTFRRSVGKKTCVSFVSYPGDEDRDTYLFRFSRGIKVIYNMKFFARCVYFFFCILLSRTKKERKGEYVRIYLRR